MKIEKISWNGLKNLTSFNMRILKRNYQNRRIYGLKGKTCLTLLWVVIIMTPVIIFGRLYKLQENVTAKYFNQAHAQEQTIKELNTPRKYTDIELTEIENYIRKVFGKDGNMAVAVA